MAGPCSIKSLTTHLSNGLPVVYLKMAGTVECCGIAIMAGSRDETSAQHGLAHFVEHTIFKGTTRRRSHHIINRMESVGGELNAYTTKEETYVYSIAPAHNTARAIELIADLVTDSTFPDAQLNKERDVIADEISSYLDQPDAAVYDDFEDLIFAGSPLGHNILGTKKTISHFNHTHCHQWVDNNYHAGRMAFFYVGPASFRSVLNLAEKYMSKISPTGPAVNRLRPVTNEPFDSVKHIKSHQAHTILGTRLNIENTAQRDTLTLCNNILGGPGMNSRFNVSLREHKGLVYTVESAITLYCDCALWTVYFGCDPEHVDMCRSLITDEIDRLATTPLSQRSLNMARHQLLGQNTLSRATVENTALALGRCTLRSEEFRDDNTLATDFANISPELLASTAASLLSRPLCRLTFS